MIRYFTILLFLFVFQFKAQVNAYAKVTAITGNVLTLSNANQSFDTFLAGEQVIIIQMQGASIGGNTNNNSIFGNLSSLNSAGLYEVATISAINGGATSMTLAGALTNAYSTSGGLQVVSFPRMGINGYTTTANINAINWDGNIGGVIAFYLSGNLSLFHNISANGIGFRGGRKAGLDGSNCDAVTYRSSTGNAKYADKGEGIYITTATQKSALGKAVNAGGGGNVHNGGGGGGSNFTQGGDGYYGWVGGNCNSGNSAGGIGGIAISSSPSRVFMGGGGGGGQENDGQATNGANGGGVILIKCDTIVVSGACVALGITANGAAALTSGQDGGGGGGGGGTIVLNIKGFRVKNGCPLTVASSGGDGADVNHWDTHGSGGGGGQGAIYINSSITFTNTVINTNFGQGGHSSDDPNSPLAGSGGGPANAGVFAAVFSSSPLPIELTDFSALEIEPNLVAIEWLTASESHNKKFEIYHLASNSDWTLIGEVKGAGNSTTPKNYKLFHAEPKKGLNYYRLKQIDEDGTFNYSLIEYVQISDLKMRVNVYPNPSSNNEFFLESDDDLSTEKIVIINYLGQEVGYTLTQTKSGTFKINLNTPLKGVFLVYSQNIHEKILIE